MKKTALIIVCFIFSQVTTAQLGNLMERAKQKTKNKVNQKIDQKMDNAIDKTIDGAEGKVKSVDNAAVISNNQTDIGTGGKVTDKPSLKSYSKFDFIPGEKIVAAEDFSQDAIGDFPARWNTNGSGEIVTTNKASGKFLMTQKESVFYPEWIKNLPDNFTLEFDLMCTDNFSFYSGFFIAGFTSSADIGSNFKKFARFGEGRIEKGGGMEVGFHPQNAGGQMGMTKFYSSYDMNEVLNNDAGQDKLSIAGKTFVHISIWRQKTRVRVYMDDKKIWDLPKAISENQKLNAVYFRNDAAENDNDAFYIGNIRLAVGLADTRNKLINEGKFVTHGILFDVNSDQIKPQSYGAIKDIAAVLVENASIKVLIVGHTDTDGLDASNLELSTKRALAVKSFLSKEFKIDAARLSTDGKGETQPIDKNISAEGKANNRRVEFIKM